MSQLPRTFFTNFTSLGRHWYRRLIPEHIERTKNSNFEFTVASYNVLADQLMHDNSYLYVSGMRKDPGAFDWNYRKHNLIQEIKHANADILCLQEVQEDHYYNWFSPRLREHGYDGVYNKRTGTKPDGCATFFKRNKFTLKQCQHVSYYRRGIPIADRDNVAIIVFLCPNKRKSLGPICVSNTHLLFNKKRGDIKLAQLSHLLADIDILSRKYSKELHRSVPVIMCGDFNTLPHSSLYDLVVKGRLAYHGLNRALISGQCKEDDKCNFLPKILFPSSLGFNHQCRWIKSLEKEKSKQELKNEINELFIKKNKKNKEEKGKTTLTKSELALSLLNEETTKFGGDMDLALSESEDLELFSLDDMDLVSASSNDDDQLFNPKKTENNSISTNKEYAETNKKLGNSKCDKKKNNSKEERSSKKHKDERSNSKKSSHSSSSSSSSSSRKESCKDSSSNQSKQKSSRKHYEQDIRQQNEQTSTQKKPAILHNEDKNHVKDHVKLHVEKTKHEENKGKSNKRKREKSLTDNQKVAQKDTSMSTTIIVLSSDESDTSNNQKSVLQTENNLESSQKMRKGQCSSQNISKKTDHSSSKIPSKKDPLSMELESSSTDSDSSNHNRHVTPENGVLTHGFTFQSSYCHQNVDGTKEVSTCHDKDASSVDYIFYTSNCSPYSAQNNDCDSKGAPKERLWLSGVLVLLSENSLEKMNRLPNRFLSSDHLMLMASFILR